MSQLSQLVPDVNLSRGIEEICAQLDQALEEDAEALLELPLAYAYNASFPIGLDILREATASIRNAHKILRTAEEHLNVALNRLPQSLKKTATYKKAFNNKKKIRHAAQAAERCLIYNRNSLRNAELYIMEVEKSHLNRRTN